jgi:hypothetical protein
MSASIDRGQPLPDELPILAPPPAAGVQPARVPSFSYITAAYNVAALIGDAVTSAIAQSVAPIEIVVCDDGSTDDLDRALAPFRSAITVVHQSHAGQSAARNTAVHAASGDFVAILDGDDVDLPTRIEALGRLGAMRPDLDILSNDSWLTVDGEPIRRYHHEGHPYEVDDQRRRIVERNFIFNPAVRRSTYLEVGGYDESNRLPTEDWECWIRIILGGGVAGMVDLPLTLYRQRPDSLTADRLALSRGRVHTLETTRRGLPLLPHERAALDVVLRTERIRLSDEATRRGDVRARDAAIAVVRDRRQPLRARARAAGSLISPAAMRWRQRR